MIKRTLTAFGAKGRLVLDTANGRQTLDYWYYTPFFWRVERDGALVLQIGNSEHVFRRDQLVFDLRLLSRPEIFARELGFIPRESQHIERHLGTHRPAHRCPLVGSKSGTMLVDTATAIVLLFYKGNGAREIEGDTTNFEVTETLDPALFGETSLEASYYHGSLRGLDETRR